MQVASLCDTVELVLAGSGHISPDDVFELQLFELEQTFGSKLIFWLINLKALCGYSV